MNRMNNVSNRALTEGIPTMISMFLRCSYA